jgi:type IV secretory pathway VirB10-like protein
MTIATLALTGARTDVVAAQEAPPTDRKIAFTSVVDGVKVPIDVLIHAQTEHQGHAVTEVHEFTRSSDKLYRLRVDRDSVPDDYESLYLIYDKDWKLLNEEDIAAPPKPKVEHRKPEPTEKPAEDDADKKKVPEQEAQEDSDENDNGSSDAVIDRKKEQDRRREDGEEEEHTHNDDTAASTDKKKEEENGGSAPSASLPGSRRSG